MLLKDSFDLLYSIIEMFIGIFDTLKINSDKILKVINESFLLALDLAELLVQDYNVPSKVCSIAFCVLYVPAI